MNRISAKAVSIFGYCALISGLIAIQPDLARGQAPPPPVPPEYQDLYTSMASYLNTFNASLPAGQVYNGIAALNLTAANGNAGPQLVNSTTLLTVQTQLQQLKAIGAKAIMLQIGFPLLYEPFLTSQGQSLAQFESFYQQVAATVRAAGMKLIIENDTLLGGGVQAGWDVGPFYATLDWTAYQQARAECAQTVAQTVQPDYLVILEEPDTEAANSGQTQVNTPSGAASLVSTMLPYVTAAGVPNMKVGAGVGSWLAGFQNFIQQLVVLPLDYIDMHVYPINNSYLPNALTIASLAAAASKPVAMSECWLNKIRDDELGVLTPDQIQARNPFSFWAPLDANFLQTMQALAANTQMIYLAPMGSQFWAAYLPYDASTEYLDPASILAQENSQAGQNMNAASFTSTAYSYYKILISPPDGNKPTIPTGLNGHSANPATAYILWNASTDDVGVAGYNVYRNGTLVGTTATSTYQDTGLAEATTYTYTTQSFDLGGNISNISQPINVTTDDVTPPSVPGNVMVSAPSSQKQILTWSPSTDLLGVKYYSVYAGIAPDALILAGQTQSSVTQFINYPLTAGTTYYYGVEATDVDGNTSAMSKIVSATVPYPPSAPTGLTLTPISCFKMNVSWQPAVSGGLPVTHYQVFAGLSAGTLSFVGNATGTSYTQYGLLAGTTYFYAVQAVDSGGDLSPASKIAHATTILTPDPPSNPTATPDSESKVSLAWSETVAGLSIQRYLIFRGQSPGLLNQIGTSPSTSYTDRSLSPATVYYYGIQAQDTAGDMSPMSVLVAVTTPGGPAAPTGLSANTNSPSKVNLTWTASAGGALPVQSYIVLRGASPSSLTQITKVGRTSYADTSVSPATTYYYAVQAVDSGGDDSPLSNVVSATTLALPSPPANVTATAVSATEIAVNWSGAQSGFAIQSYSLYRGLSASSLTPLKNTSAAVTSYNDYGVSADTTYYYGVQTTDTQGNVSPMSIVVSATTIELTTPRK